MRGFDKCLQMYNPSPYQAMEHFHHPGSLFMPLSGQSLLSSCRSNPFSLKKKKSLSRISHKWNQIACTYHVFEIHPFCCMSQYFVPFLSPSSGNWSIHFPVHRQFIGDYCEESCSEYSCTCIFVDICFPLGKSLEVELLGHMVGVSSVQLPYCEISVQIFALLFTRLVVFLLLCCSSLYRLDISPLKE